MGALWSVLKGIVIANPVFGIACIIICFGGILYKAKNIVSGGGMSMNNHNIKIYFLLIFFMFILYNERK